MENKEKEIIEIFTQFMSTVWDNPNLTIPKELLEKYKLSNKEEESKNEK